ncbi:MAG: hypothetical protein HW416_2429 [Chloroflexi bacterium]|nr:hypothetical protein [Chloroflexota bacterium]
MRRGWVGLTAILLLAACAPARPAATEPPVPGAGQQSEAPRAPRGTIHVAWGQEPNTLAGKFANTGATAQAELSLTFNSALAYVAPDGKAVPQIARELPSQANGSWAVNPDGTMATTYRLRENAKWHDGAPLTARDLAFTYRVYSDPEIAVARREPESFMSAVEAVDDHTLAIAWKQPYYGAGSLRYQQMDPLPRHLLEERYLTDKASFLNGPEWTTSFVGSGPFKLERWDPGAMVVARAFDDWVLGPPKAAALEIRFITDANTIVAGLLAGELDVTGFPWVSPTHSAAARDRWEGSGLGRLVISESRMQHLDFQFKEVPNWQPAIADLRVRRALMHATDRQSLTELINESIGGAVADAFILRSDPSFAAVDPVLTRYPYDQRQALALFAEAGWTRPTPDGLLTGPGGQTLRMEFWSAASSDGQKEATIIVDSWRGAGIDASIFVVPQARSGDGEFRASFPTVNPSNRPILPENFIWTTINVSAPANRFTASNRGAYSDPEIDNLASGVLRALGDQPVRQAQAALHKRFSETLGTGPLYYPADIMLVRNNVKGPLGHYTYPAHSWNTFEWEIAS